MKLITNQIYHVYNRGNNKQKIFFTPEDYHFFLQKVKKYLVPYCDILAYSLMENHFHFLIHANHLSTIRYKKQRLLPGGRKRKKVVKMTLLSHGFQLLLSSYTKTINKKYDRTGSLFQQNTKCKMTSSEGLMEDYSLCCFVYIHNNPVAAGLVPTPNLYEFSSFRDYTEDRASDSICNLALARELLCMRKNDLFEYHNYAISDDIICRFFR